MIALRAADTQGATALATAKELHAAALAAGHVVELSRMKKAASKATKRRNATAALQKATSGLRKATPADLA